MEVPSEDSAHHENHEREQDNRAPTRAAQPTAHTHAQHTHPAHSAQPTATIARYPPRASKPKPAAATPAFTPGQPQLQSYR